MRFATLCLLALLLALGIAQAQEEPRIWVHAPAEDLLGLFPEKGAGFLISIEEYRKLLDLAQANERKREEQPPLDARIVRGTATGRIEGDTLFLEAIYTVVVQSTRPVRVPFPLSRIALERIAVEGGEFAGASLHFGAPGTYMVAATLSTHLKREGEILKGAFALPPAAAHTVTLDLPKELEGEVGPIVRAFDTGKERGSVVGYPDRNGVFTIWVRPRSKARKLDPLLSASFDTVATLGEARTVASTALHLEVLRAPMASVDLMLAPGQTVRALTGKGVKSWRALPDGRLEIRFVEPLQGKLSLGLEVEVPRDGEAKLPLVRVPRAVRYRGTAGLVALPEVRIKALSAKGARRTGRIPKGMLAVYEIWSPQAEVTASIERIASKTRAVTRSLLAMREEGKTLHATFTYRIAGKPLFRLEPNLPAGWILRKVQLDNRPAEHRFDEESGKLVMVFPGGLKPGVHRLEVLLDTDEVDWVPGEGSAKLTFSGLRSGLDEESGYFAVASDTAFRVETEATSGLRSVGIPELVKAGYKASDRLLYAWRFERPDYAATFSLVRHSPQISSVVINRAIPSERLFKTHTTVFLNIERAGIRELEVSLPAGTGKLVDFQGPMIKEKRAPEEDADPEVWTLVFQKRVRGVYRLEISFDREFESDAWSTRVPAVALPGTQERGFVVVHAPATTALSVDRNGMREADVGELPEQPARPPLEVLAYARHPYEVTLTSTRHEPHEVIQAIALSARIYGVITHEGHLRCRAEYRVRNNDQPFLAFGLPQGSELIGVLVDGEPKKPLVEKGMLKLPLPRSRNRETPFLVALVYDTKVEALSDGGEITVRCPQLDIDVLKTQYTLHLPGGYELTDHDGDLVPLTIRERKTVLGDLADLFESAMVMGAPRYMFADGAEVQTELRPPTAASSPEQTIAVLDDITAGTEDRAKEVLRSTIEADETRLRQDLEVAERKLAKELKRRARRPARKAGQKIPPSMREPSDPHPPPAEPDEEVEEEDLGELRRNVENARRKRAGLLHKREQSAQFQTEASEAGVRFEVAQDSPPQTPASGPPQPAPKRKRPERALLSLDVQFLRPDNVYRLDSLAPTGAVTLAYGRSDVFSRQHYLGIVLGAVVGLLALVTGRFTLVRIVPAAALAILALHFAGLSFLPADLARGAGVAILFAFVLALLLRLPRLWTHLRKIRLPFRRSGAAAGILLLAAFAQAQEEIYVPYRGDEVEKVDRVFLPADEYHRLRKLAYPDATERATALTTAEYKAQLQGEELAVTARYEILKETREAERVPLRLNEVAVTAARLNGEPATLTVEKGGYVLVLAERGRYLLELTLRPRLAGKGEARSFTVPVRPVAGARLTLEHDRTAHEVDVVRLGAKVNGLYHVGPVAVIGARWSPKTEGFKAAEAELRARTEAVVSVRDGYTGLAARVRYGIAGGEANRFRMRVSKDLVLRRVTSKDLAGWEIDDQGILVVALTKPARNSHVIEILGERPSAREREESFPSIEPLDVLRDAGVIALETLPDLKLEVLKAQGLLRGTDAQAPKKLTAAHDAGSLHSVHRFAVRPFELEWRVFLEATRMRAEVDLAVLVEREKTEAGARIRVVVERGPGPFTIPVTVPPGYEVYAAAGNLRDWWVDNEGILHLARATRQASDETYVIALRRRARSTEGFPAPALSVVGASRESGLVRIAVVDGLVLEASEANNLLPEDIAKVPADFGGNLRRAYRYVRAPWGLTLSTREEPREMEAMVVSRVVPLQDRIRVEALVNFYVRRGLVDRLSFVVPVESEAGTVVSAPDLREERSEPTQDGRRRYTLLLRTPTRGSASALVTYHLPAGEPLRGVEPEETSQVRRYVAVEKVPDGEVRVADLENLEAGEFGDLPLRPPETTAQSVARVLVGSGAPFSLTVKVKRHAFEEVAPAVIYRAAAQAVVDLSGYTRVQVAYRVYNRTEQFLHLRLPPQAELMSVLVAGEGVRPLRDGPSLLVPLRKVAIGAPTFDVDVVYAYRGPTVGDRDAGIRLPGVLGLDVRRTTLSLYLPKGYDYSFETDMETAEEADITAGEAADVYQEIKELYSVAERGSSLQVQRALSNVARLEEEAMRLADEVQSKARSQQQRDQVESQQLALGQLRRANDERIRDALKAQAKVPEHQTAFLGVITPGTKQDASDWDVNRAYIKRFKTVDEDKAVQEFLNKKQQFQSWQTDGSQPQAAGETFAAWKNRSINEKGAPKLGETPVTGYLFGDSYEGETISGAGGGAGGRGLVDGAEVALDATTVLGKVAELKHAADKKSKDSGRYYDGDGDGDFRARTENIFRRPAPTGTPSKMRAATGRLSIRIELPLQGEVFHFAQLGPEGGVEFAASREDGRLLEGLLAILAGAAAVIVLRYRLKPS